MSVHVPCPQGMPSDIRTTVLDPLALTPAVRQRLAGLACARCGGTDELRPGGHAYTRGRNGGRLGWTVRVCAGCPVDVSVGDVR